MDKCDANGWPEQIRKLLVNPSPCSISEITTLEQELNLTLPNTYRAFLAQAGKGAGNLWKGSECFYKDLRKIQEWAKELLEENNFPVSLPNNTFVFFMHQGYQFSFFKLNGQEDSSVYYYCEGQEDKDFIKTHNSFGQFLAEELLIHGKYKELLTA